MFFRIGGIRQFFWASMRQRRRGRQDGGLDSGGVQLSVRGEEHLNSGRRVNDAL